MKNIILASASPRRKQLLEWAQIPFEVIVANTDESFDPAEDPANSAIHIAVNKALAVREKVQQTNTASNENLILAADTIVVLDNKVIGKPEDKDDAIKILTALSGRQHQVITGVCILSGKETQTFAETTFVEFHRLSPEQIEYYVDHFKPYDKAGAYAIQEWIGVTGVKSINGDFYNVMGLPISRVVRELNNKLG
jgi:septum formation protein